MARIVRSGVAGGLACLALAGCDSYDPRSLIDPYVANPRLAPLSTDYSATGQGRRTEILAAQRHAAVASMAYLRAVRTQDITKNIATIALTAAVVDLGYLTTIKTRGVRRFAAGVGAGASGAFILGNLLISKDRQTIYLNGFDALTCAVDHSSPYLIPPTEYDAYLATDIAGGFRPSIGGLSQAIPTAKDGADAALAASQTARAAQAEATSALGDPALSRALASSATARQALRQNAKTLGDTADKLDAAAAKTTTDVATAQAAITAANGLITGLASLKTRVDGAAAELETNIGKVELSVDRQILSSEPSVSDIKTAIGGFAVTSFGGAPAAAGASTPAPAKTGQNLSEILAGSAPMLGSSGPSSRQNASAALDAAVQAASAAVDEAHAALGRIQRVDSDLVDATNTLTTLTAGAAGFANGIAAKEQKVAASGTCAVASLPTFSMTPPSPAALSGATSQPFLVVAPQSPTVTVSPGKGGAGDIQAAVKLIGAPPTATTSGEYLVTLTGSAATDATVTPRTVTVTAGVYQQTFNLDLK